MTAQNPSPPQNPLRVQSDAQPTAAARTAGPGIRFLSGRSWADVAVLLTLVLLGVIGFEPSFGGYGFLLAGLGGLAVGAATGILSSMFRLGLIASVLVAVAGFFLFGTVLAVPQQGLFGFLPTLESLGSLAIGSVYGWADIVTLRTPIGAPQYIAVVPYVAAWLSALIATTLAARWLSQRPRTPWRFGIALLAPVAMYLTGVLLGTDEPYQAGIRGITFAVIALIWLGWRRSSNDAVVAAAGAARLRNRKLRGTAVLVIAAVLLGGGAGFWLAPPNDERFVLRDEIEPPFDPLEFASPLSGFRHFTKQVTDDVMFTVKGLDTGDTIRLATLDSFDGKLWNVTGPEASTNGSGSFSLVGRALPRQDFITPGTRKNVTFTIDGYADVWVPSVGYPTSLQFTQGEAAGAADNLRYNNSTGTAVLTTGLSKGDSYTMDALVQQVLNTEDLLETEIEAVELPPVTGTPDLVMARAQEFTGSATTPMAQLEAMRRAFIDTGYLSHGRDSDTVASRAGHGADRVQELLERVPMVGDQEQYASTFALMARSFGYPARVVMGFAPEITEGQNEVEVTGDDVTAWVEVAFAGVGWVAFNPTPDETDIPQDQTPKPQSEPQPQVRQPPRADSEDEDLLSPVELEKQDDDGDNKGFVLPGWVYALALSLLIPAAIVLIPALVIGMLKARRMRRRRDGLAGHDQAAGAWDEMIDRYSELGFEIPTKSTRKFVAVNLEGQLEGEAAVPLRPLALATDEAVFSGRPVETGDSDVMWTEAIGAAELARGAVSRSRRLLSRYRLRRVRRRANTISKKKDNS